MKISEKSLRTRYLRILEKFANAAISALKKENFDEMLFQERMLKNYKLFEKCEVIKLNSSYIKELESFVNACLDFKNSKAELLSKANNLDKLKKSQTYKKDKHKSKFKEYE
ncbi:hypothetical protein GW575_06265 [Campylobacter sp. MIT 19-121]|uniref:hypothetical protein n=1 Tax=Campylobacter sp. MIT 19-121 TaxID=2703906 RepID=UPI001389810E|nr:hypothetical protein [Campylobacter sp. MIT 19-121]NDJ27551.1 hypothetical protein [Campylobacter sp. MIT 19-121]